MDQDRFNEDMQATLSSGSAGGRGIEGHIGTDPTQQNSNDSSMPPPNTENVNETLHGAKARFRNTMSGLTNKTWEDLPQPVRKYIEDRPRLAAAQLVSALVVIYPGLVVTPALGLLGFSSIGPVAGSAAAGYQSINGATTVFSMLQSAAMGGYAAAGVNAVVQVPTAAGAGAATFFKWHGGSEPPEKKKVAKL